jgi:hypothetical protein
VHYIIPTQACTRIWLRDCQAQRDWHVLPVLFYVYHGQDVRLANRKHKPTNNIHIFKAPFIKQHYLLHLKQHAKTWEEYNELSIDDKKVYFNGKVKHVNTMHMYIDTN